MLTPETILQERYRIIRQLGQGGMGAVYEAMDQRLDAVVALKETLFADERLRKQFEREARLLARMHHPALPRVSDHFAEGDGQFLVMQFIDGDDLAQMMTLKQGHFPPEQVLTWGDQLLDALDYLHTQEPQIIHRDIKPQNLKLTTRGQIILLDFGLAKGQPSEISPAAITSASIFGYTPNYAPLEQIQGLGTDARSDIYALSATLYHLMTAVRPPSALTRAAALVNGQADPLQPASLINSAITVPVASVLARGMSQNREQRYPTALAMRKSLADALAGVSDSTVAFIPSGAPGEAVNLNRNEAATVLFDTPAATLPIQENVSQAVGLHTRMSSGASGETTVVHRANANGKRNIIPWAIGAAVLVVMGIVGGLYAYQLRKASSANPPANLAAEENQSTPGPSVSTEAPVAGSLKEEPKPTSPRPSTTDETKRTAKSNEKAAEQSAEDLIGGMKVMPPRAGNENSVKAPPAVEIPETPALENLRRNWPMGGTSMRKFPDGSQVVTLADGTKVVTLPNGTTRVLRPGKRVERRRRLP